MVRKNYFKRDEVDNHLLSWFNIEEMYKDYVELASKENSSEINKQDSPSQLAFK